MKYYNLKLKIIFCIKLKWLTYFKFQIPFCRCGADDSTSLIDILCVYKILNMDVEQINLLLKVNKNKN